ncbi:MAG: hypothetical protein ACI4WS_10470 [Oscillospiraceae bacterium]
MYYMSKEGTRLVESKHLYIDGNTIFAVVPGSDDIALAEYEVYGDAQEMLRKVCEAIEDGETVFVFN